MKNSDKESLFKEEVADDELHSKLGVDDHIYIKRNNVFGWPFLVFLAIVLALTALFATMYGFVSLNNSDLKDRGIGVITSEYHLTVVHSDNSYGGTIKSFNKYNNSNKYFNYKFSVSNNNSIDLNYAVSVQKTGGTVSDISLVNYDLLKNESVIKSGKLVNSKSNKIFGTTILSKTTDNYEIRFWSDSLNDSSFAFKIVVLV